MKEIYTSLSESQMSKSILTLLGLPKKVSVRQFKATILPKIPFHIELRGVGFGPKQRHTKTYYVDDIQYYITKFVF